MMFPPFILESLKNAHISWRDILIEGLIALENTSPGYLNNLSKEYFLPTNNRLFNAFEIDIKKVKYVLIGESPYPREQSACGYSFMDGAVDNIWSENGLSKSVNRATSLRNWMKLLLVAHGFLSEKQTSASDIIPIAKKAILESYHWIQTLSQFQDNLINSGFLLLNASLVFRTSASVKVDTKVWQPFLNVVLTHLAKQKDTQRSTLILWGKLAGQIQSLDIAAAFKCVVSEHPYNLSFISNKDMQRFFKKFNLLAVRL